MGICGPNAQTNANQQAQANFYTEMTQEQSTVFQQQQDLLAQIQSISLPILAKGPNQYGFTPQEDALLQGTIENAGAQATANAVNAAELRNTQATGGDNVLPTGAEQEIVANANILGEQQTATNLANEKLAGFQAGNQLYTQALNSLMGVGSQLNPTGYASTAVGAGNAATGATELQASESSNLLQSILGGVIQGGLTLGTGAIGQATGVNLPSGGGNVCWVAAELYGGWNDPRTIAVRKYIMTAKHMRPFLWFYQKAGRAWARIIQERPLLRFITKVLFDKILEVAQ